MAIKSADQISIVDVTDAYSVILTSEAFTFPGSTSAAKAGSTTTQIIAMRGAEQVAASVTVSEITKPSGVTVSSDGHAMAPTLTITVAASVTSGGVVKIPVHIGDITVNKEFSFAIAFTGATGATGQKGDTGDTGKGVKSTAITYQKSTSGTTIPTGTWSSTIPAVAAGEYLWTRTVITYTDNDTSTSYSVGMMGATGATGQKGDTGKGVKSTAVTYQTGSSGTTAPTGTWSDSVPSASAGQYVWTKTVITYTDNTTSTSYSVGMIGATGAKGDTGAAGADAISMSVTSSNGTIFKNTAIETVLTAHVYKAGKELSTNEIAALGAIKWYKDGGSTAVATGATLTIDAGDVTNKATYVAQLEG